MSREEGVSIPITNAIVTSTGELVVTWTIIKAFFNANKNLCTLNYIDLGSAYYLWVDCRSQKIYIPNLVKETADCIDFETNFKVQYGNIPEATRMRITTNKLGRRLHDRFITFTTSSWQSDGNEAFDNTAWDGIDYGDVTYVMKDINGNTTLVDSECTATCIQIEPPYDYEIAGGAIFVPSVLSGNQDTWEIHVIGAPTIPQSYGGSVHFIANPRLEFMKGQQLIIDANLNPAELKYSATLHSNRLLFMVKHDAGVKSELQINIKIYK